MLLKPADMRLRDTLALIDGPYGYATVTQIKDDHVHLLRPYVITSDFSYTGGVIPSFGFEQINLWVGESREYNVVDRREVQ